MVDQMLCFAADELVLEFANREMAELALCRDLAAQKDLAIGVVDVKNTYLETTAEVAERIRAVLTFVSAERLSLVPDCGFSQTPRGISRAKLRALVAGARTAREELSGSGLDPDS